MPHTLDMATNDTLNALVACTGCRSHARINITNYVDTTDFYDVHTIHRIHCGECCTTPIGAHSPFEAFGGDCDAAVQRWNKYMADLRQEELEYEHARLAYENTYKPSQSATTRAL